MKTYELKGNRDIVVIIPTADHNGKLAKHAIDLFKGLQIILIESNGPFFNYARSCNYGFKRALRYKPRWIILSSDDVESPDNTEKLITQLNNISEKKADFLINPTTFTGKSFVYKIENILKYRYLFYILTKFHKETYRSFYRQYKRFGIKYKIAGSGKLDSIITKPIANFYFNNIFWPLSYNFIKNLNGKFFDEGFINGMEDSYASFIFRNKKYVKIDFKIDSFNGGGNSLIHGVQREFRQLANRVYFSRLIEEAIRV